MRLTDGKFIAVEIKKPKGRVSDEQVKFRDFFEKHNVIHGIAHSRRSNRNRKGEDEEWQRLNVK